MYMHMYIFLCICMYIVYKFMSFKYLSFFFILAAIFISLGCLDNTLTAHGSARFSFLKGSSGNPFIMDISACSCLGCNWDGKKCINHDFQTRVSHWFWQPTVKFLPKAISCETLNKSLLNGTFGEFLMWLLAWVLCAEYHCVIDHGCCLANDPSYKSAGLLE